MQMDAPDQRIEEDREEFIGSIIGNEVAPVWVPSLLLKPPCRPKDRLLGRRKVHKEPKILHIECLMRNQYEQHYLERRSISVTLVFGSHEPIPSVCWTITGTGPEPGHLACS
jgi:hypothetical protein